MPSAAMRARSSATMPGSSSGSNVPSGRTWGVATTIDVPSATAARASSRLSAIVAGPSSTPGSRWK